MDTIDFPFRCIECGADLQGEAVTGACEQCDFPIAEMLKHVCVDVASGSIGDNLPCARCDYNLRTLAVTARCPECAVDVHRSLRSDTLRCADVSWLQRVRLGVRVLAFTMVTVALGAAFLTVTQGLFRGNETIVLASTYLTHFTLTVVQLGAVLAITQREPHSRAARRADTVRQAARVLSILLFVSAVVQHWGFLQAIVRHGFARAVDAWAASAGSSYNATWSALGPILVTCIAAMAWGTLFVWLRHLASRAGRQGLSQWLMVVVAVIILQRGLAGVSLTRAALASTPGRGLPCVVMGLGAIYLGLAFVVLLMCTGMLTEAIGGRDQSMCGDDSKDGSSGSLAEGDEGVGE